jgi:single-stranded-DNA-specific exonuclease
MKDFIKECALSFTDHSKSCRVRIVAHTDTDGITSAAIISRALNRAGINFSLVTVKSLSEDFVSKLPHDSIVVFLDLGSSSLESFGHLKRVFVIDHHEIKGSPLANTCLINPLVFGEKEELCSSSISYFFSRHIDDRNVDLAHLAVIGSVGAMIKERGRLNLEILSDARVSPKKGLLLYPATRPLDKVLEYSSSLFIPGVTGNAVGSLDILKEAGIIRDSSGKFKSLIELNEDETSRLLTSIFLRRRDYDNSSIIGNIYLVKFFNRLEDAREISALINACSRAGFPGISLSLCLDNKSSKAEADRIHAKYRQEVIEAVNFANSVPKIVGEGYVIINAGSRVRDSLIGTVSSIISFSSHYKPGTFIIGYCFSGDKVKFSLRIVGSSSRRAVDVLSSVMSSISGEWGGHASAAGCLINKSDCDKFLDIIRKHLEIEVVQI